VAASAQRLGLTRRFRVSHPGLCRDDARVHGGAQRLEVIPVLLYVFTTVNAFQTTPFFGREEPTTSFMYFSLTTLTTVGYGDLAAVTPIARLLATSEAVIGQVYLVTFVAMLVALFASRFVGRDGEGRR
jgi:carbon starvation protein CstA